MFNLLFSTHFLMHLFFFFRILYGRLLRSFNNKAGQHNRELIFRFLTGCNESEWMMFIKMGFQTLDYKIQGNFFLYSRICDINGILYEIGYVTLLRELTTIFSICNLN